MESKVSRSKLIAGIMPGLIAFSMGQTALFSVAGPVFRDIGLSESQLGIIISSSAAIFVVSSAVWGKVADSWGRRPTILFGLFTYGTISLAFAGVLQLGLDGQLATASVFIWLLVIRLLYAALGAGIQPAAVALMADHSKPEERSAAVALVGAAFGIGMVLGPASAALFVGFGVLVPLYVIAMLGILGMSLAYFLLPKSTVATRDSNQASEPLPISTLALLLLGALLIYTAMSTVQQTLAFNLQDLLQTDSIETTRLTGYSFVTIAIATLAMQGGVIQSLKPAPQTLLLIGVPVLCIGFFVYAQANSFIGLLAAAVLFGVGFGLATPGFNAAASVLAGSADQGRIAGVLQATAASGFVIGPIAGTSLYELDRVNAAYLALGCSGIAVLLIGVWLSKNWETLRQNSEL